jgi:hypothetical protein
VLHSTIQDVRLSHRTAELIAGTWDTVERSYVIPFVHVIKLLETPKGDDEVTNDRRMLERLRGYASSPDR